ncbi:MAG: glycolate oxidase subunit GlcE [Candidatus Thiodiazotropha sp. 6PLUC9]
MTADQDQSLPLQQAVLDAHAETKPLRLVGSDSKAFYGRAPGDELFLSLSGNRGIVSYEPTELVITARGGTPLIEIEEALNEKGQMLPFEPPHFANSGTIGGAIAAGLSGPRRPWGGAPRDLLLGIKLLDGQGRILEFGGQVMKNVAGYDISRLMAGAMGTLGILLEVSVKVLPKPSEEHTLIFQREADEARNLFIEMVGHSLPISATFSQGNQHGLRLSCNRQRLTRIQEKYGLMDATDSHGFWEELRDQKLDFFDQQKPLWRLSLQPTAQLKLSEPTLYEWSGAQRWVFTEQPPEEIRAQIESLGGHAVLFRNGDRSGDVFHPLHPRITEIQKGLKAVFDPKGLFNPGRHHPDY